MGFAPDGYYSFEALDGTFNGLVRITDDRFECVHEGAWIDRPTILRHFVNPDVGNPLEPIDEATARRLADRYGVTLESLSRKLPQQDPHDPDPTFASPKRPTVARRLARRTAEAPGRSRVAFKTRTVVQPTARSVRLRRRSVRMVTPNRRGSGRPLLLVLRSKPP